LRVKKEAMMMMMMMAKNREQYSDVFSSVERENAACVQKNWTEVR
jgi:hypothetical protein